MNLEIINKAHKELKTIKDKTVLSICVEPKSFYFSRQCVKDFKMNGDEKYIHFAREEGNWYLIVNTTSNGFKIRTLDSGGARIHTSSMVRLFTKSTGKKLGSRFYLQKTKSELAGVPVIEILTAKSIQELIK